MIGKWFEVWIDDTMSKPSLVLVTNDPGLPGRVIVLDPQREYQQIYEANDYDSVKLWLLEDECYQVKGRMDVL